MSDIKVSVSLFLLLKGRRIRQIIIVQLFFLQHSVRWLNGPSCFNIQRFSSPLTFRLDLRRAFTTALCTGLLKACFHVTCYVHHGTPVVDCFLEVPKAFHFVSHDILYQRMRVWWNQVLSEEFPVSNWVRQGGVLSPMLFTIYLLVALQRWGVGCFWLSPFTGAVCCADDLALLAPSSSAFRIVLHECGNLQYLVVLSLTHLRKTQLIRFGRHKSSCCTDSFLFCGLVLSFSDSVTHLGHVLRYDLSDEDYIALRNRDMIQKANCVLMVLTLLSWLACFSLSVSPYIAQQLGICPIKLFVL